MQNHYTKKLFVVVLLLCGLLQLAVAQGELRGRVVDLSSQKPIQGATIYLPDLRVGTSTNANGEFVIRRVPTAKVLVQASFIGYRNVIERVSVSSEIVLFPMEPAVTEINEVVVTGSSRAVEMKRMPTPISVVDRNTLSQVGSTNIIDAIGSQPGVSQITTGAGISKPIIRGLGYNRVLVISDGVRQEGQQWGDEHGVEVDEHGVDRVEILKGPASLAYGSDAMAGVISLISAPLPANSSVQGSVATEYQTNNGLAGVSANVAGNGGSFVWSVRASGKMAHSYKNRYDGYVFNSGFKESSVSSLLGLKRNWGFSNLTLSYYRIIPGIVEGERDDATGKFLKAVNLNGVAEEVIASDGDAKSYSPFIPRQEVSHYKAVLSSFVRAGNGSIKSNIGIQQNLRKEFANVLAPSEPELYFKLNTLSYDVQYQLPDWASVAWSVGTNGMGQGSRNLGDEVLVPEYNLFDFGVFSIVRKSFGKLDLTGGVRFDTRHINSRSLFVNDEGEPVSASNPDAKVRFSSFSSSFSGVSGSLGFTYQLSKYAYLKANLSRGYRAPNIAELGSNGVHEGTIRYEIGDAGLKPETSLQSDLGIGVSTEHISGELNLFHNTIDRYIFLRKLSSVSGGDSLIDGVDAFRFVQGDATLFGGEARFDIHPHPFDWIHFENSFSFVIGRLRNQPSNARNLPFIPAPKLVTGIKVDAASYGSWFSNGYIRFDVESYFKQDRVYSAYSTETATPGYVLLNAGAGFDWLVAKRHFATISLGVNNIADRAYQSHLSRLKYAPENLQAKRTGIYNMGRNFIVKISFPIGSGD